MKIIPQVFFVFFLTLSTSAFNAFAQPNDAADHAAIRSELESIYKTDQDMRMEFNTMQATARVKGVDVDKAASAQLWKRIGEQDRVNQKRVTEMIDKYGWPKKSLVGLQAATAAFLVIQHAELDVQLKYVERMREAVMAGEASKQNLALLEDRLLIRQGKPQRYGSQVDMQNGVGLKPTEDEANLDARRATMGLGPICEYLAYFVKTGGKIVYPPCVKEVLHSN